MKQPFGAVSGRGTRPTARATARGFTLVELMVAMVAGMFVSIAVFSLAKHASAFSMRQSRIADATLQSVIGFERLKADISRAGFLSTPNIERDPNICPGPTGAPAFPAWLLRLASVYIEPATEPSPESTLNGLSPRSIVLAGSYSSPDLFVARAISQGNPPVVTLQRNTLGMANIGYTDLTGGEALGRVFKTGRALRIVDDAGGVQFARIAGVAGGSAPTITLAPAPGVQFRSGNTPPCGVRGMGNDFVNVVDFIRYDIRDLRGSGNAALPATLRGPTYETTRRELVRVEQDVDGNADATTQELVAEYAVDLNFSLFVEPNTGSTLTRIDSANLGTYAGNVVALTAGRGPQLIRAVHAWLSVRSQEADRESGLRLTSSSAPGPNLLRISLHPTNAARPPFARVRTLQSTIALVNQASATWQ